MKIVCDNCATKYSIADEKVRGKVFKIRCKKCSHIIVVKGIEGAEVGADSGGGAVSEVGGDAAADVAPAGDGWHVVINGEQVGPLSPSEIRSKFSAGEIDAETFAWREGFGDWQRLASIDDFRDLAAAAAPPSDTTKRTGADDLFGAAPSEGETSTGGDLFGTPSGDLFAGGAPAPAPAGAGLFAQPAPEPAAAPRRAPTPGFGTRALDDAPASAPVESKAMTGQRNENSVLFSLNNLQALASGGPPGGNKPAPSSGVDNRPGFANSQTEGSGLIDIRAMAAATLSSSPTQQENRSNDMPGFSSAPVFSPIAAPILMPSAPSGPPRWVWPVIGLGLASVISILVVGVLILNKKPDQVAALPPTAAGGTPGGTVAAPGTTGTPSAPAPAAGTAPTPAPGEPTPPAVGATAPTPAPAPAVDKGHSTKTAAKAGGRPDKGSTAPASKAGKPDAPPVAAEAPSTPKKKKGGDDLDDLLNGASPDKGSKPTAREDKPSSSDENLPDQLDKGAIVTGMGKVKGRVAGCYEQYKVPGLANVSVTIGKNGKVSNASVAGAFAGTPTGDCVQKAVKTATFSQFKGSPQTINYPFMLR